MFGVSSFRSVVFCLFANLLTWSIIFSQLGDSSATSQQVAPTAEQFGSVRLPIRFEQFSDDSGNPVFVSSAPGHTLRLARNAVEISLKHAPKSKAPETRIEFPSRKEQPNAAPAVIVENQPGTNSPQSDQGPSINNSSPLRMTFPGSSPDPDLEGVDAYPFQTNYLIGNQPNTWRTQVQSYSRVQYKGLFPGTDLLFYGTEKKLEYDFVIAPKADPSVVRIQLENFESLFVDSAGNLQVIASPENLHMSKPYAYQEFDGKKQTVTCSYNLHSEPGSKRASSAQVSFSLGSYDANHPLVIDPILTASSYLGGGHEDSITGVDVDSNGNIYLTGWTQSLNYPTGSSLQNSLNGNRDAFVTKLNPDGRSIVYSTFIGGDGSDDAADIKVGPGGRVFLTGTTTSDDFPTKNPLQESPAGSTDAFVLELSSSGSSLSFSSYLGGSSTEEARALALDDEGSLYVTGTTRSGNFPTKRPFQEELAGSYDTFLSKISGGSLVFSTYLGGTGSDQSSDIAIGEDRSPYLAGSTTSIDFPVVEAFQDTHNGSTDAFICRFAWDGSALVSSTYLGGSSSDSAKALALDEEGRIYTAGETSSANFPLQDPLQSARSGAPDMFAARLSADAKRLEYSTYLGGLAADSAVDIAVDDFSNLTLTGYTASPDFPMAGTLFADQGNFEIVVARLDATGTNLQFSTRLGGSVADWPAALAEGPSGSLLVAGTLHSIDFPTMNPLQAEFAGEGLYKTSSGGTSWQRAISGLTDPNVQVILADPLNLGTVYAGTASGGIFKSTNRASSWNYLGLEGFSIRSLAIDPINSDILYAGTEGFVYMTSDGGQEWEVTSQGLPITNFTTLAVDPQEPTWIYAGTDGRGIFKSTNGGGSWRAINSGLSTAGKVVYSLVINPDNPAILYLGSQGAVYTTTNWGDIWELTSYTNVGAVRTLAIDEDNPSTVYASGVFSGFGTIVGKTEDGGENWVAFPIGGNISKLVVDPFDTSHLIAATTDNGILESQDAGENWEDSSSGLNSREVQTLAIDHFSTNTMYAGTISGADGFLALLEPTNIFYFPQIADGQLSRLQFQTTLTLINTGGDTEAKIEFFGSDGSPLELTFEKLGTGSSFVIPLSEGQAISAQSPGIDDVKVGYAKVTTTDGVDGTAVFTRSDFLRKTILFEAGVPSSKAQTESIFLLDSIGDNDTGVAIVNPGLPPYDTSDPARLEMTLYDEDLNLIDQVTREFAPGQHRAQFISELFPEVGVQASEMYGIVTLSSDKPVVAVTVRQRDDPGLWLPEEVANMTTFPVLLSNNMNRDLYFPQVVDGVFGQDKFQTIFVLANAGFNSASVTLTFYDFQGVPMPLTLEGIGERTNFRVTLVPKQFIFVRTAGVDQPKVGYAKFTSTQLSVGGTAIFTQADIPTEVTLFEAGVPATSTRRTFSIYHDSLGDRDTGVALVNASEEVADISVRLYDLEGQLVGEDEFEMNPARHMARYTYQLFPDIPQAEEMEGVLTVESSQPLAAVTVRQINDPVVSFPAEVPTLTTFPVIPGVAGR